MSVTDGTNEGEIIVGNPEDGQRFDNLEALADHVLELLETRGGVFAPKEQAAIRELAQRSNGDAPPGVARIARKLEFHTPKQERYTGPTPLDDAVARAEAARAAKLETHDEANRAYRSKVREAEAELQKRLASATTNAERSGIDGWLAGERAFIAQLREDYHGARRELDRATARLNSLLTARDRWRHEQTARYHNHEDPSKPLTHSEMLARLRQERQ